ncbi:MAG: zinc ribbon domain-containing protein [Oscillospiraceae bacterium]|nr:zinc ribbon domain-containing protein [Oscillospiraceae bacterium]
MGFFDDLTASVSRTAKQVSENAKTMADKNRIKKDITSTENELRNRFCDIGEHFYNENVDNPPAEFAEVFAAIAELKAARAQKQHELELIDGTVMCQNCGASIALGSKFCPQCGATAPAPTPAPSNAQVQPICPFCGQTLAPEAMFCASCGNKLPAPAEQAPVDKSVCPNCGQELAPDAMFCAVCGTKAPGID